MLHWPPRENAFDSLKLILFNPQQQALQVTKTCLEYILFKAYVLCMSVILPGFEKWLEDHNEWLNEPLPLHKLLYGVFDRTEGEFAFVTLTDEEGRSHHLQLECQQLDQAGVKEGCSFHLTANDAELKQIHIERIIPREITEEIVREVQERIKRDFKDYDFSSDY